MYIFNLKRGYNHNFLEFNIFQVKVSNNSSIVVYSLPLDGAEPLPGNNRGGSTDT
jgi:hypothetical protein